MSRFHFTCSRCHRSEPFSYKAKCECGGTLLVAYDMEWVSHQLSKERLPERSNSMWRFKELLPVHSSQSIVSLGEGCSPLLPMSDLAKSLGLNQVWVKRVEQNPTGSFKARGFSAAVSILKEAGVKRAAVPSNGNAASALAAYSARAGIESVVIVPKDCPAMIVEECIRYHAATFRVDGYIHDAAAIVEQGKQAYGWANVGTLKEPGRAEGKKTMGLEIAEQLQWSLPDVIIYPTGGGSGVIGLWKAFHELRELGWIEGELPRIVSVQEEGCDPIVQAMEQKLDDAPIVKEPTSSPTGMRVPAPPDARLILSILRETEGAAVTVSKSEIKKCQLRMGMFGISSSPEGGAALAACQKLRESGWLKAEDRVVLFNTSHADKYWDWPIQDTVPIVKNYNNFTQIAEL